MLCFCIGTDLLKHKEIRKEFINLREQNSLKSEF